MVRKFFNENFIIIFYSAALALVLGGFAWTFFMLRLAGTDSLILHFNNIQGITNVGGLGPIVFIGFFALLIVLMNFALAREFAPRDRFLGRFIAVMTFVFAVLLFMAFVAIISVNV